MNIQNSPFSCSSSRHHPSNQEHSADPGNNTRPESSTSHEPFSPSCQNGRINFQRFSLAHSRGISSSSLSLDADSASETDFVPFEECSHTKLSDLDDDIQRSIVERAAITSWDARESAKKLVRISRVSKAFQKFSHDIQESKPDIKQGGEKARVMARQKSVLLKIDQALLQKNLATKEQFKTLLADEPHVSVCLNVRQTGLLLEVLKEKKDIESLCFRAVMAQEEYRARDILSELKEIKTNNPKLRDISLVFNYLCVIGSLNAEDMVGLAEALNDKNKTLSSLELWGCHLDAPNIQVLAEALKENSGLQFLSLVKVNLDDEGAQALAEALKKNKTLQFLNLRLNNFVSDGPEALAHALKKNTTLKFMNLTDALRTDNAKDRLESAISKDDKERIHY